MTDAPPPPIDYGVIFDEVFERLGGMEGMLEWAASSPENLKLFYQLIGRRLPNEVTGAEGGPLVIQLKQL